MRLDSLFPKLSIILAVISNDNHRSEIQQKTSGQNNANTSPIAPTTISPSPPSPPTPTPSPPNLPARTPAPFTNPLLPTHPPIFYETATAYRVISGQTLSTTYTDLISNTLAIPYTLSTELPLSALSPPTTTTASTITPSLIFPIDPSVPPGSPTPTLDLGACSTATGDGGARACENGVIGGFNSVYGGETSGSGSVTPTKTVTEVYLGAEVAKGEPTWRVGGQVSDGVRSVGQGGWRGYYLFAAVGGAVFVGVVW